MRYPIEELKNLDLTQAVWLYRYHYQDWYYIEVDDKWDVVYVVKNGNIVAANQCLAEDNLYRDLSNEELEEMRKKVENMP